MLLVIPDEDTVDLGVVDLIDLEDAGRSREKVLTSFLGDIGALVITSVRLLLALPKAKGCGVTAMVSKSQTALSLSLSRTTLGSFWASFTASAVSLYEETSL